MPPPPILITSAVAVIAATGIARRYSLRPPWLLLSAAAAVAATQLVHRFFARRPRSTPEHPMDWLDAIQAVGVIVDTFSIGLSPPTNVFLDSSLQRILHSADSASLYSLARRRSHSASNLLVPARDYLDFALATYGFVLLRICGVIDPQYNLFHAGARAVDVAAYMLGLAPSDVLHEALEGGAVGAPRFFLASHHSSAAVVLAIRGTNSVSDLVTDLLCGNEPFAAGYAHAGMLASAAQVVDAVVNTLTDVVARTGYRVVVTGHSLGAGVAMLVAKMLIDRRFDVTCYAIAPPPVFGPLESIDPVWRDAVHAFVHGDDLVARLCFASAKHLARDINRVSAIGDSALKRTLVRAGQVDPVRELVDAQPPHATAPGEFEKLFLPSSHVHWLLPCDDETARPGHYHDVPPAYVPQKRYRSFLVPPTYFEQVLVTADCVSAHFINSYTAAFAGLDLPPREKPAPPKMKDFGKPWYSNEFG